MAHAVILSKDRAAQLHLCLESLSNGLHIFDTISVLYHASNDSFEAGYEQVRKQYFQNVRLIEQEVYYDNIIELINGGHSLTAFFTDDDILFRPIPVSRNNIEDLFDDNEPLGTLSLRLGLNTVIQDPYIGSEAVPPSSGFHHFGKFIAWRWEDCPSYGNFGYPLSVDGHIFRTNELKKILLECKFNDPNQQEVAMQHNMKMLPPIMTSFEHNVLVNTPLNRVQGTCLNRAGEKHGQSAEDMNTRYLNGEKLDFGSIDFSNIRGCHQELEIKWTTK